MLRTPPMSNIETGHYVELLSNGHQDNDYDDIGTPAALNSDFFARRRATKRSYVRILATSFVLLAGGFLSLSLLSRSHTKSLQLTTASLLLLHQNDETQLTDDNNNASTSVYSTALLGDQSAVPPTDDADDENDEVSTALSGISFAEEFENFIVKHRKQYATAAEKALRFEIFVKNFVYITRHNCQPGSSYKLSLNSFADLTNAEFTAHHVTGFQKSGNSHLLGETPRRVNWDLAASNSSDLPAAVDWRKSGCVGTPKDQKKCGSCWTFSTAGAVEGAYCLKHGTLFDLSEQQMLDCGFPEGNQGCNGGMMDDAFKYIMDAGGICLERDYPYNAKVGKCRDQACKAVVKVESFEDVPNDSELALRAAIAEKGPISVAIDAESMAFQFYHSGVFDSQCGTDLNHAVLAVGYGRDEASGKDYWIVKNSWGSQWGDGGFIKMRRNSPAAEGECGIQMSPSYPVVS